LSISTLVRSPATAKPSKTVGRRCDLVTVADRAQFHQLRAQVTAAKSA
jgi:hypothetical protein